jgi:hypothetical protein
MSNPVSLFERLNKEKPKVSDTQKPTLGIASSTGGSPGSPSTRTTSSTDSQTISKKQPIAPDRDYQKVSNSIVREAIPGGLFKSGKCKQLYDALYSLTRGSISPQRKIRINKPRLMKMAGIGTRETLWQNLKHLEQVELIEINVLNGEHGGNEYTVYLPEELKTTGGSPSSPTTTSNEAYSYQNLPVVPVVESTSSSPSYKPINTGVSDTPKTSLKTNTKNDDEAFSGFIKKIQSAAEEITGKKLSRRDNENLEKFADLLILELKIAARRTDSISSVSAFLTEVVRRKLRDTAPVKASKVKINMVGKPEPETYEIKPLDAKGREVALSELREFTGDSMLEDFKKWYTPEDWVWLLENLK